MAVPSPKQKLGVSVPLLQTIVWCVQKHDCRTKALPKTQERLCATANKNTTVTNEMLSPCRIPGQKGERIFAYSRFLGLAGQQSCKIIPKNAFWQTILTL
jgi:hypothetical protein